MKSHDRIAIHALLPSKRCPFTLQKVPFCNVKDALLERDLQLIDALMVTKLFLESFRLKSTSILYKFL